MAHDRKPREPKWLRPKKSFTSTLGKRHRFALVKIKAKRAKGSHPAHDKRREFLDKPHAKSTRTAAKAAMPAKAHTPKNARAAYQPVKAKGLSKTHRRR